MRENYEGDRADETPEERAASFAMSTQIEYGPFDSDGWVLPSQPATEVVELPNAIAEWHPAAGAAGEHSPNLEGELER
jgi:hypothetical protein